MITFQIILLIVFLIINIASVILIKKDFDNQLKLVELKNKQIESLYGYDNNNK